MANSIPSSLEAYLLIHHSPIFPAHQSLFIPNPLSSSPTTGKLINIRGNSFSGFQHEIMQSYDTSEYSGKQSLILLGNFDVKYVDFGSDSSDKFSQLALQIPAPTKSLKSINSSVPPSTAAAQSSSSMKRVQLKNCQTWMKEYVDLLVKEEVLEKEASDVLDGAAKN